MITSYNLNPGHGGDYFDLTFTSTFLSHLYFDLNFTSTFLAKLYFDFFTSTCAFRPIRNPDLTKGRSKRVKVQSSKKKSSIKLFQILMKLYTLNFKLLKIWIAKIILCHPFLPHMVVLSACTVIQLDVYGLLDSVTVSTNTDISW